MKSFLRQKSVWLALLFTATIATLYAQEPAIFERGITVVRGNVSVSTGDLILGIGGGGDIIMEGATANAFETTFTVTDPTADRTITWPDATGTVVLSSESAPFVADNTRFGLGSDIDFVFYLKSAALTADEEIANVIVGTSDVPAAAANSLIMSNITADGDFLWITQTGGNSQAALFVDASAGTVNLYGGGVQQAQVDASSLNLGVAGTTTGRLEISGSTSGTISLLPANAAGTYTLTLPSTSTNAALFYSTLTTNAIDVANSVWGISNGIAFGGLTGADGFEIQLTPADVGADRVVTIPDMAAASVLMASTLTTNAPEIANSIWFSSNTINFEGATANTEELVMNIADVTADLTITWANDLAGTYRPMTNIAADVTGGVFIMPPFGIAATDNDMTMADNTLYVYRVYVPQWITVANVYARGTQGAQIAGSDDLLGVAIYEDADAGADLASSTSADFTATADVTFNVTDVTLGPGMYRVAVCSGDADGIAFVAGDPIDDEAIDVYNLGAVTIGTAANACVAGDPPTTTGALTTADILMPVVKLGP